MPIPSTRVDAMLRYSRKKMLQRKRKPLPKHAHETFKRASELPPPFSSERKKREGSAK